MVEMWFSYVKLLNLRVWSCLALVEWLILVETGWPTRQQIGWMVQWQGWLKYRWWMVRGWMVESWRWVAHVGIDESINMQLVPISVRLYAVFADVWSPCNTVYNYTVMYILFPKNQLAIPSSVSILQRPANKMMDVFRILQWCFNISHDTSRPRIFQVNPTLPSGSRPCTWSHGKDESETSWRRHHRWRAMGIGALHGVEPNWAVVANHFNSRYIYPSDPSAPSAAWNHDHGKSPVNLDIFDFRHLWLAKGIQYVCFGGWFHWLRRSSLICNLFGSKGHTSLRQGWKLKTFGDQSHSPLYWLVGSLARTFSSSHVKKKEISGTW